MTTQPMERTGRVVTGVLGEKLGMTQVWDADNRLVPVTLSLIHI